MKVGILLHVYNLMAKDWEHIVWGDPAQDALGVGTKLFECMLAEPEANEVTVMLYDGPSHKDGMTEGNYTKRFLLDKLDELQQFPRFHKQLAVSSDGLRRKVEAIRIGEPINNTFDEIQRAAHDFAEIGASKVIHIAAASHAPRCIQLQAVAKEQGLIRPGQQWYTVAGDTCFAGAHASDTAVAEPPHRADDPLLDFQPMLPQIIRSFYKLSGAGQKMFLEHAAQFIQDE